MEENQSLLDLQVDREAASNLTEVSRWAKLLAMLVCICFVLASVLLIVLWSRFSSVFFPNDATDKQTAEIARIGVIAFLIIVGVIGGIMMSFLIKGANRIRLGIHNRDQLLFNSGLNSFKNYFAMYGVIALLGIFFELIGLVTK
jgi:hypothetical protein